MNERSIFLEALENDSLAGRAAYLDEACKGDALLRQRVEALLASHEQAGSFLGKPVPQRLAEKLATPEVETRGVPPDDGGDSPAPTPRATVDGPLPTPHPGTVIGPYKLLQQIGEGGMGTVYMAEQSQPIQRKVALKIIKAGMDSRQVIARFEAERQALALMDHVNIARVFDGGATENGLPYFVMELVHGVPITKYCDDNHLTPRERLELFVPVCQAIQHAHQKGIIHRDIKPSNVMVTLYDGKPVPKVIDFGVAKAMEQKLTERTLFTQYGTMVGTLEYMSPEQAEMSALGVDTRSDIYSLGVLLYELLTGSTPLSRQRMKEAAYAEILRMIKEEEPPKPSTRLSDSGEALASISAQRQMEPAKLTKLVKGELDWIVMKTLEKDRNRRYETASDFAADVQRYLDDEQVQACPPSVMYKFRKYVRRNKRGLAIAGLILFFLVFLGNVMGWALRDQETRRQEVARQLGLTEQVVRQALDRGAKIREELHAALSKQGGVQGLLNKPGRWELFLKTAQGEVVQARNLIANAKAGLDPGWIQAVDRLEQHFKNDELDYALALRLEKTRLDQATWREGGFDFRTAAKEYSEALAAFGVLTHDPGAVATRVGASPIKEQLVAGLDAWAQTAGLLREKELMKRLLEVARLAPSDPIWGNRLRQPTIWRDQEAFAKLLADVPVAELSPQLLELVGFALNRNESRVAWFRRAQARHPADFWLSFDLANELAVSDPAEASGYFRVALAIRPTSTAAYNNLGNALKAQQKLPEAIDAYNQAIKLDPKFARAYYNLGSSLYHQRKLPEAIAALRTAIECTPNLANGYHALGRALLDHKKLPEAIDAYDQAIKLDPNSASAYTNLGLALASQQKLAEAIDAHNKAVELDPKYAPAYNNLGLALRAQQKLPEAIEAYNQAIKLDPKSTLTYLNLGNALKAHQELPEAIAAFNKAIELDPKYAPAYNNLGLALRAQQKLPEAIEAYNQAIKLDPNYSRAYHNLGLTLCYQQKPAEGIDALNKSIELEPKAAWSYHDLGVALNTQGKFPEAIAAFRKVIELNPRFVPAYRDLGVSLKAQKRFPEAITVFRKAIELDSKDTKVYYVAAIASILASVEASGTDKLNATERACLRGQALDWLRTDLTQKEKRLADHPDEASVILRFLRGCLADPDLSSVREAKGLAELPREERELWTKLWSDVRDLKDRVQKN